MITQVTRGQRIAELEGEVRWHNEYVQKIHRAISKVAGYSPAGIIPRIEKQLQRKGE